MASPILEREVKKGIDSVDTSYFKFETTTFGTAERFKIGDNYVNIIVLSMNFAILV